MKHNHFYRFSAAVLILVLLCGSISAASIEVTPKRAYELSAEVFSAAADTAPQGIYISALPSAEVCTVVYNGRILREGDVLSGDALSCLAVRSTGLLQMDTAMEYRFIENGTLSAPQELSFHLAKAQNTVPTAQDGCFETYKNISYSGTLQGTDADGDAVTFSIVKQPKRGCVELSEDGSFVYTPTNNKVGRDRFTFTASDPDGNVSEPAEIEIRIKKPIDGAYYTDMRGSNDEFYAVWLREEGAYNGKTLGGSYVFEPNSAVSRGEFLMMAMQIFGHQPENTALKSGFADELSAPSYVRPYLAEALRSGYISGSVSDESLVFRPDDAISCAEAAVITQNIARLPEADAKSVFSLQNDCIPSWASSAFDALCSAGVSLPIPEDGGITRLECAKLLFNASHA